MATLSAQDVYSIDPYYPVHDLQQVLRITPDKDQLYQPEDFLQADNIPLKPATSYTTRLEVGTIYWGVLQLEAKEKLTDWTLHFEDKMLGPPAWTKSNGKVDVYGFANQKLIFHQRTGVEYPKAMRAVQSHWVLNQVSLTPLPPDTTITLVIRAEGNELGYPAYFNLSARSPEQAHYHQIFPYNRSFNIFMFGVTFIILLYHFLQYIYVKDTVYLWFSVWLLFCTLIQAMTVGLFIGATTQFRYPLQFFLGNGLFFSVWFFGRSFMNSKEKFPKLDRAIKYVALFLFFESVITILYIILFDPQIYYTGVGFHYIILSAYFVVCAILSVLLIIQKDRLSRYFGMGTLLASIFFIMGSLWAMQIIRPIASTDPFAAAMFLQVTVYSFGIAYRRQLMQQQSQKDKLKAQRTSAEVRRMKDLDEIKMKFFANISHEFRTPLSLIKGPLQNAYLASQRESRKDVIELSLSSYELMNRNADRLKNLIDELLDLSRLESGKVFLSLTQGGLIAFLRRIIFSFESLAERQNISLNTSFPAELDDAFYDRDKLEKIVSNVLSNAFKYTSEKGSVTVAVEHREPNIIIKITDTGKGISSEDIKHIFERFYRVESNEEVGSGIGLALTKELVELHNGKISVHSTKHVGTTFKIRLPITLAELPESLSERLPMPQEPETKLSLETEGLKDVDVPSTTAQQEVVLIVEDNTDLRSYIRKLLTDHYDVLLAVDGLQGERMAFEHIPDLIISDIMMPKKDGYELCHSLKTNTKTSHIPIIMLTAKADQDHKIEGLTQGADAYISKPFDERELRIRIRNLILSRKKLWDHFRALDMLLVDDIEVSSIDDKFLQQVFKTIKENLDNELFSVEDIARNVGFSRSQLHRKLKALSGKSTNQLIIEIRMNEAHRMLSKKMGTVSEVAYSVGYTNLSYFTKSFKEKFGTLPSKI
ncbi:MAG: response regulator [Flavobacteriaceae bacterium]|nr:response regulator [Flavobacteriaceae bacterium]